MNLRLTLLLAALTTGCARPAPLPSEWDAVRARIGAFMAEHRIPGGSVALGRGADVLWSEGFGLADVENGVRATAETAYRTASIGKSMAAVAAMELADAGKLELDTPIQKYCPRYPAKPWPITTRHLLTHTSGITHYEDGPNQEAWLFNTRHFANASEALALFESEPLKFRPGTDYLYSTWGYVTLGCVLEGASGEDLRALMRRTVFAPAGMNDTRDDDPRALVPRRARGYALEGGALVNARWVDMSSKLAAGGWLTTAPDLVRFAEAFLGGKLVASAATRAAMLTPTRLEGGATVDNYGMGFGIYEHDGVKTVGHGGGTPGVSGLLVMIPSEGAVVSGIFDLEGLSWDDRSALAYDLLDLSRAARAHAR